MGKEVEEEVIEGKGERGGGDSREMGRVCA